MLIQFLNSLLGGTWRLRDIARNSRSRAIREISLFIYTRSLLAKGSWISTDTRFAEPPVFPHGIYGIFISGNASIGRGCVIFQQVTIGSNTLIDSRRLGAPKIGDNCYIGAGAKIIGRLTIGNNVRVGANATVVSDVPDNSLVITGGQRIITREYPPDNRFFQRYEGCWRYHEMGKWCDVVEGDEQQLLESHFPTCP